MRGALPGFRGFLGRDELMQLARRDDVESRLVVRDGARWSLAHGPLRRRDVERLPARNWTLLVQGVNLHVAAGDALLRQFAFIPYARLDDLMVSYAAPGGGVGPHLDAYDVFLLQGEGRRRWRYGRQQDPTFRPNLPLRILRRFAPAADEVLHPGDMLYLPPEYAHDGVALDACTTYSIGFRAPLANEIATAFLDWMRDTVELRGRYADPDLAPVREPARIGRAMQRKVARILRGVRWNDEAVARFLGAWLSEPKPSVFFAAPESPPGLVAFRRAALRAGIALDRRTQLLYDDDAIYMNGSAHPWPEGRRAALEALANARSLAGGALGNAGAATVALLHEWYCNGFLHLASRP